MKATVICLLLILCPIQNVTIAQKVTGFKGYGSATCPALKDDIFIKNWLILGPIGIGSSQDSVMKKAFNEDFFISVAVDKRKSIEPFTFAGKQYTWRNYTCGNDIIKLNEFLGDTNNVLCYALSEINATEDKKVLIGLGSDDGVKVWINGKEVHKNNTGRAVVADDDIFEVSLNKGSNQVLIKIQNGKYDYGFSFRPLGKDVISDQMIENAGSGDFDNVKMLMNYSPDLKKVNNRGLTAWQVATISGRNEIARYLEEKGAEKTSFPLLSDLADKTMAAYNGKDSVPGIAVLVAKDGRIIYQKGFGNANIERKLKVNTDTKFRIGSITKQFTAAAILRLQEQGKINIADKLSTYIPDFPRGNEVTIQHLLTHTSGMHSYTDRSDFGDKITLPVDDSVLLKLIESEPFDFNPGDKFSYCNSGYYILGYIVSKISGKPYGEYLSDEFFKPLGMKNSGVYNNAKRPENEAVGYRYENGKAFKANDWDMTWAGGAGAIYSTVEDLFIWNEAIFNGKVLNQNSMKMAFTPAKSNSGQELSYGFGWFINDYRGLKFISHSGGLDGFLSYLVRQPDEKLTVAVLTNSTPAYESFDPGNVGQALVEYTLWKKMASQSTYFADTSLSAEQLKAFEGKYDYGQGMVLTVTLNNKNLMAQLIGQPAFEIFYMGNNEFYWKVVEARIKFILNEQGIVTGAIHYQGGQQLNVSKLP